MEEEGLLFPRKLDFKEVCSCHECCTKINALKDFEKVLLSKLELVQDCKKQITRSMQRCRKLVYNIKILVNLFDLLHDNLRKVNKEDLGFDSSPLEECDWVAKLKNVYMSMNTILYGHEESVRKKMDRNYKVEEGIHTMVQKKIPILLYLYERCQITDEAHELLNMILDIENQHESDKKSAAKANTLDPSISKMYIERQIEFVKELPFEELERETKEIFEKMYPCEENIERLDVVIDCIGRTSRRMFQTSIAFRRKYLKINCNVNKGHDLSGLQITLESLTDEMKLFNVMWKRDYFPSIAHVITLCQQAEAEGFCPQGLCSPFCTYH